MNFDVIIDRRGSGSIKWDRRPELDPYWLADMDFQSPECITRAVHRCADFGVFGYAQPHEGLNLTLLEYLNKRHGVSPDKSSLIHLGGLVCALSLCTRAFATPEEELMTCSPIYYPFLKVAADNYLRTVDVPHIYEEGKWCFDMKSMAEKVTNQTKIFLLCNPQNPLGRVFSKEEIIVVAEFCHAHNIVLVSDEIHCDLVLDEQTTPFFSCLSLPDHLRENLIVLQSPSKTYNIAGMGYAFAIIENESVRRKFNAARKCTLPEINCIAFHAAEAAYRDGEPWRQELLQYLKGNRDLFQQFIKEHLPTCKTPVIEATYLGWIDCRGLDLKNPSLELERQTGLFVSDGAPFGGPRHIRFNYGCPRSRVLEGLEKIHSVFQS